VLFLFGLEVRFDTVIFKLGLSRRFMGGFIQR
jgi:hypothetical protein